MAEAETVQKKLEPKSQVEEAGPCRLRLRIEISAEKVRERLEEKYRDLNNSVSLPGFRKGHAPRNLMERKFGKAILDDLKGDLLSAAFDEVREERQIEPIGEPEIDVEKLSVVEGQPFAYDLTVEVRPTFDLQSYTGLKVVRPSVDVTGEDVDRVLTGLREARAELVPAPDAATAGDQVIVDILFLCEEKEIDRTENANLRLTEDIHFYGLPLKDYHRAFAGKKSGESADFEVDLPPDFRVKEAAGKKGILRSKIKSVKRRKLPELDEAFAKSLDMDTIEELREHVSKRVRREKEGEARSHMADHLVDQILSRNDFPMPEGLVKAGAEEALTRLRLQLAMQGVQGEEAEQAIRKQSAESEEGMRKSLKIHFILEHIAKKERLFVTEDQIEERIGQLASLQGRWPHEMKAWLEEQGLMTQLRRQMREERVREFLLEKSVIEDAPTAAGTAGEIRPSGT